MREWAKLNTTPLNFVDEVRAGIDVQAVQGTHAVGSLEEPNLG